MKILMIAPSSYPVNGAEGIVNIKLLRALSQGGLEIDLISKKSKSENYPSASIDTFGIEINSLHVVEVDNKINVNTIVGHILSLLTFGIVFKGCHWAFKALSTAKQLVKSTKYDYVLTKDSPSILLGYYLKKKYSLKWIASWNDPYPSIKYPKPYGNGIEDNGTFSDRKLVFIMRNYVDMHIFPSDRLRNYMLSFLEIPKQNTVVIPHVVLDDIQLEDKLIKSDKLKIIHSGNLNWPRNPRPFLNAFRHFLDKVPNAMVQLTILGIVDSDLLEDIAKLGLAKYVCFLSPIEYSRSLELLQNYHVALIIEADCEEGVFLPTKVSDFMQCHKRIFTVSPATGVLNDLYKEGYVDYFAECDDILMIEMELLKMYSNFINGVLDLSSGNIKPDYLPNNIVRMYANF